MPRAEIFLTSKLWCSDQGTGRTRDALAKSLAALGTNYLDLFLIHAPRNSGKTASETKRLRRESWKEMQQLVAEGAVQSIGVSNFTVAHLRQLKRWGGAMPAVNQGERLNPGPASSSSRAWHAAIKVGPALFSCVRAPPEQSSSIRICCSSGCSRPVRRTASSSRPTAPWAPTASWKSP